MKHFFNSLILETISVEQNVKSAIIGYWRMGATMDEIMSITNLRFMIVMQIITDYELLIAAFNEKETIN